MLRAPDGRPARLRYLPGSYQVLEPGDHVRCAVTGVAIPLAQLRYWSHELQEAYVDAEAAHRRWREARAKGLL
ncbi:MAG: DUF2093 domain-containing protein [Sphingomonadaceae bacterium]|uniref:DUF2093 domain-containing protein n=1 Tax=Thermaurantiacus sp. TaxID=2820283 RepID=UPI00298F3ADD|nr:DUF2093 domain-containing protein [Thermaurantiacus sp.]MCS6987382.1 DUF2093 domain-containing protein [Sphingomonadaceae bacterium]MDW8415302.1 DUF2093 domain-containing protein [Thermaurantiacus sp.]